jgi:dienelactone hydrolase
MKKIALFLIMISSFQSAYSQTPVSYEDGKQKLNGIAGIPVRPNKAKAGILILPAWKGIDNHSKETAVKLTSMGYHTFIADIYGEGDDALSNEQAAKLSGKFKKDHILYQRRISLALSELKKLGADVNNMAIIGYCFGGTGALEAARGNLPVKGVVSVHGGLAKDSARANEPIAPKVLVLHGADDPHVPDAEIKAFQAEMRESKADWQMIYYHNAVHAFSDPYVGSDKASGAAFDEVAARRSWEHMLVFFREIFK